MLIRSQDRKMIVNMAQIDYITITSDNCIRFVCEEYIPDLGYYSTEEKAMKVLDMIEKTYLKTSCDFSVNGYRTVALPKVFQMPAD